MDSFGDLMFTAAVRAEQEARGATGAHAQPYRVLTIGPNERLFIETRKSFYMATVNSEGWPYVQHRGGPAGFLKVVDAETLAFADYPGNRQYVSTGNLAGDGRVSLFLVDYPRRARLKLLARAEVLRPEEAPDLAASLVTPEGVPVQRIFRLRLAALDWNCPKYITPRFDEAELNEMIGPEMRRMAARIEELEAALAQQGNRPAPPGEGEGQ